MYAQNNDSKLFQIRLNGEVIHKGFRKDTQALMLKFQRSHPEAGYKMEYLGANQWTIRTGKKKDV